MKKVLLFAAITSLAACNTADTNRNDNINDATTTVPATRDSIPNNPSPNSPRNMPPDSSPSTIDSAKLHQ